MDKKLRVRFAPSPTGGLHLGGMRTVLYNFLFARKHGGEFILRIEDTDQSRYVEGAEDYIFECLQWAGLEPDESPRKEGQYGPYRQSERKHLYRPYAEKLIETGGAYYAFDTPEELAAMREQYKTGANPSPQYDHLTRMHMRNSLTIPQAEVKDLLAAGTRHVIRVLMPQHETIGFTDLIRGPVNFETALVDDKVLLKADGMPTYHLAVVVDDYLMKITHAFRGEEWLPSAPVHLLLWKELFGLENMPEWAHFPLILGPNGKLSKRDGMKYGFPVFAMNWQDRSSGEITPGFREKGFLPEAFINLLALLGWNDGTEQELFSKKELIEKFSIDRVHSAGAKFDYEKAKWFNHEWIRRSTAAELLPMIKPLLEKEITDKELLVRSIELVKDRCSLLGDFPDQLGFFFSIPAAYDLDSVRPKWNEGKKTFFEDWCKSIRGLEDWKALILENNLKALAIEQQIKPGELQMILRIMLVGKKSGPGVFDIAEALGKDETVNRVQLASNAFTLASG